MVDSIVALSITVFEPMLTLSFIITFPICGIVINSSFSCGANPKPSLPITEFE